MFSVKTGHYGTMDNASFNGSPPVSYLLHGLQTICVKLDS